MLLVLLYHNKILFNQAGYLGVDIFFIISGFLITGIIRRQIKSGNFSFKSFYYKRSIRILPASFTTIIICTIISTFFLTSEVQVDFINTAVSSFFFFANISLWLQSDYFSANAALQPLLHMWSLAIEEQFYFFLPFALFVIPRRWHFLVVCLAGLASVALCLALVSTKTSATFYLLPTRAWALLLGAALAIKLENSPNGSLFPPAVGYPCFAVILLVPLFAPGKALGLPHPSLDSVLVCVATAAMLATRNNLLASGAMSRVLRWFGDISYSLYLVHWPIVAFLNNAYLAEQVPLWVSMASTAASVALALLMYHMVENPIRYSRSNPVATIAAVPLATAAALLAITIATSGRDGITGEFEHRLRPNLGLSAECEFVDQFDLTRDCSNSEAPEVLVWGDSYAMHLVPALTFDAQVQLAQATKSVCGPIHRLYPLHHDYLRGSRWIEDCMAFNASVMAYLATEGSADTVVLSSVLNQYFHLNVRDPDGNTVDMSPSRLASELEETVTSLRALGKKVVFVAPPPSEGAGFNPVPGYDVGLCLERVINGKFVAGRDHDCKIDLARYQAQEALVLQMIAELEESQIVPVYRFEPLLCNRDSCLTRMEDTMIYRDKGHLSYEGSRYLSEIHGIGNLILQLAD